MKFILLNWNEVLSFHHRFCTKPLDIMLRMWMKVSCEMTAWCQMTVSSGCKKPSGWCSELWQLHFLAVSALAELSFLHHVKEFSGISGVIFAIFFWKTLSLIAAWSSWSSAAFLCSFWSDTWRNLSLLLCPHTLSTPCLCHVTCKVPFRSHKLSASPKI